MEALEHGMSAHKAHSIQEALRLGESRDIWYYTHKTTSKQSIPAIVDTRFYQALTSLGPGSSTVIFSVDQGLSDVILAAKLPTDDSPEETNMYTGLALPKGWIYQLINRISVRYGSSSQYFWTGSQIMIQNLREMPNPVCRDQLFELGGAEMDSVTGATGFAGDNLWAYAYLNLPHNSPNGSMGKPNPFPTELIAQPVVITIELNQLQNLFSSLSGSVANAPRNLEKAYVQVRQVHAKDAGELMSMPGGKGHAYSFPTKAFYQNQVDIVVQGQTAYDLLLTGFRNGEVRSIFFWVTKNSDVSPTGSGPFVKNYTNFVLPSDIELLYNGTVYYRAKDKTSQMWSLISTETPPQLEATVLSIVGGAYVVEPVVANWVEIPFSQVFEQLSGAHMYVAGKLIQNAVVNLNITLPDTDAHTVHVVYSYNCALMIADKACEYAF